MSVTTPAFAQDESEIEVAMNVGALGVVDSDDGWNGEYIYFGPSLFIPVTEHFAFIPVLTVEAAPESGYWGFVGTGMLEYIPSKGPVAFDIVPSIGTDTDKKGSTVTFWAVGPGATITFSNSLMLGAAFQASGIIGDSDAGIIYFPLANLAIPIP